MSDLERGTSSEKDAAAEIQQAFDNGGVKAVISLLKDARVSMVGRRSCPYSMEAKRVLDSVLSSCDGGVLFCVWVEDVHQGGAAMLSQLKHECNCTTVPMVFIGGEFVGGCDEITEMHTKGELLARVCTSVGGKEYEYQDERLNNLSGDLDSFMKEETSHVQKEYIPDEKFYDAQATPALTEHAAKACAPLFYFPEVVDNNVVRVVGLQIVIINILGIIWRKNVWTHYMILGLALDNLGRFVFGPGPSPLGQLAKCVTVPLSPSFKPGIPKQFANGCGLSMSIIATVFLFVTGFDPERVIASCFMGVYAALAGLEAGINFCMGCYMFGWLVRFGAFPKEIYSLCISSVPEYYYTYHEATKVMDLPEPERITLQYPGKPPSLIDVRYKTKSNDHDAQSFGIVKYTKASHFGIVLGILGLASLWRLAGNSQYMVNTNTPGDVLAIMGACSLALHGILYLMRCIRYRKKVYKDWMHPINSNAMVIPPASFVLLAFCTYGRFDGADTLAKVLFWIGAPATLLFSIVLAARWITDAHSQEHVNAAWLLTPTANFVCALVAPFMDSRYTEAAYLWFSFGVAIGIPVYVITMQKAIVFNDPDDRVRLQKWGFVAVTSVASVANTFLAGDFTLASKVLYFISLSLGLMLGCLYLTGHFSRVKFDPTSSWMIAFPLEALAIATVVYASYIQGTLPQGMAYAGLGIASWTVATLGVHTIFSILMRKFFMMDPKYGPLSQQILTHEAFRTASVKLRESLKSLGMMMDSDKLNQGALKAFALLFRKFRLVHQWHALHEEKVIFKEFEDYVPGSCLKQHEEHEHDEELMLRWSHCLATLESGKDVSAMKKSLVILHREIPDFLESFEAHLQGEEKHLQRLGRKQLCFDLQKDMIRRIWNMTPTTVWAEFLPFVVENIPMQQQRVKFVRAFALWSLPERAQMMGRMIALGVEPNIWERLVSQVPEIAPRGEPRYWRRNLLYQDLSLLRGASREVHLSRVIRVVSRTWLHCAGQNDDVSFGFTLYDSDVGGYMLSYQLNMVAQGLGIPKNVATTSGSDLNGVDLINFLTLIKLVTDKEVVDELKLRTSRNSHSSDIPAVETCKVLRTVLKTAYVQKLAYTDSSSSSDDARGILLVCTPSLGSQDALHGYVGMACLETFGSVADAFMHHFPKSLWTSMASYNLSCTWMSGNTEDEVSGMLSTIQEHIRSLFASFSLVSLGHASEEDISRDDFVRRIGLRVEDEATSQQADDLMDDLWKKTAPQATIEELQTIVMGVLPRKSPLKSNTKFSTLAGGRRKKATDGKKTALKGKKQALVGRGQRALKHARVAGQKFSESEQKGNQNTTSTVNQGNHASMDAAALENICSMSVCEAVSSVRDVIASLKDSIVEKSQSGEDDMKVASDALQAINTSVARAFCSVDKYMKQRGSAIDMDKCRKAFMDDIPVSVKDIQELHKTTKFEKKYEVVWTAVIQLLLRFSIATFIRKEDERPEGLSSNEFRSMEDIMHILIATMSPIPSQGQRFFIEILKPAFVSIAKDDIAALERSIWDEEELEMEGDGSLSEHRLAAVSLEESGETPDDSADEQLMHENQDDCKPNRADKVLRKMKSYKEHSVSTSQGPAASADGSGIHGTSSRGPTAVSGPRSRLTSSNLMSRRFNNSKQYKIQVRANINKVRKQEPPKKTNTMEMEKKAARRATKEQVPDTPLVQKQGDGTVRDGSNKVCTTPKMLDAKGEADVIPNTSPREEKDKQSPAKRIGSIRQPLFDDVAPGVILPSSKKESKVESDVHAKAPSNTWLSGAIIRKRRILTDSGASRLADMQTTMPSTGIENQETEDLNKEITSPLKIRKIKHVPDQSTEPPKRESSAIDPVDTAAGTNNDVDVQDLDHVQEDIEILLSPACTDEIEIQRGDGGDHGAMPEPKSAENDSGLFSVASDVENILNDDSMEARNQCTTQGCSSSHLHGDDGDEGITSPGAGCIGKENQSAQTPQKDASPAAEEFVKSMSPLGKSNPQGNKRTSKRRSGRLAKMLAGPTAAKQTQPAAAYAKRTTPSPKKKVGIAVEDRGSPCKPSPGSGSYGSWARQQNQSGPPDYSSDTDSCIGDTPDAVVAMKPLIQPTPGDLSDEEDAAILNAAATGSLSPADDQNKAPALPRRKRRRSLLAAARGINDPEPLKKSKPRCEVLKAEKTPTVDQCQPQPETKQQLHLTDGAQAKKVKRKPTKAKKMPLEKDEIICFVPFHGGKHQVHCVIETIEQAQLTRKGWICTVRARPMDDADGLDPALVKLDSSKEVPVGSPTQDDAAWCRVDSNSPCGATILQHTFSATIAHNEAVKNVDKISPQDSITVLKKNEKNSRVVFSPPRRKLHPCNLQYSGKALASAEKIQSTPPLGNHTKSNIEDIEGIELFPEMSRPGQKVSPEARAAAGAMLGALYAGRTPLCSTTIDKVLGSPMGTPDKF